MVSRRKILSRSKDDLNLDPVSITGQPEDEEDVWYHKEKLFKEHIQEVLEKWSQIDDEIWAKVIVFEKNRRLAKAYVRAPVLTVNGSDDGFDGMRIGLCGFDNPNRDSKTEELKRHIERGVKIKMDDAGNILIRRYARSNVYVKSTALGPNEETSIGADVVSLPNQALEIDKIVKLFDMKKFQSNVNRELRRAYPDRRRLETQCLSVVTFVRSENEILECPIWILVINVVAMDMLKTKLPTVQRPFLDIKNRPKIPIPDEDPYSIAGNGSNSLNISNNNRFISLNGNNGHVAAAKEQLLLQSQQDARKRSEKPPKLPPRDNIYPHEIPKPDYDDLSPSSIVSSVNNGIPLPSLTPSSTTTTTTSSSSSSLIHHHPPNSNDKKAKDKNDKNKDKKDRKYDDPYYCGLRARVPNFVKMAKPFRNNPSNSGGSNNVSDKEKLLDQQSLLSAKQQHLQQQQHIISKRTSVSHIPTGSSFNPLKLHHSHSHPHHMAASHYHLYQQHQQQHQLHQHQQQMMWRTKSFESGIDSDFHESPYTHLYGGRVPLPTRGYIPTPRNMYIGEWD
ncbi:uncharacterized protein LOC129608298 [Condylostylus longicornis]|uniref:uncharacterized protein LOC129608298 n=1 Tax=Condylostylus longicornis TaxID=2530218 RepID=UPI00244E129F|nr:uncharacterized protein LOC129608298 [Condylostylus longicornis]